MDTVLHRRDFEPADQIAAFVQSLDEEEKGKLLAFIEGWKIARVSQKMMDDGGRRE